MKILSEQEQLREAHAILDEIYNDVASPLHNPRHPKHEQVENAVVALEAEILRLSCELESKSQNAVDEQVLEEGKKQRSRQKKQA
jgi:hypothetical protein